KYTANSVIEKEITYLNSYGTQLEAKVKVKFSIVKEKFYVLGKRFNNPGDSPIGKYIKDYTGISIVRAEREVDWGKFGFFDIQNSPYHRWWGVEIQFEPLLDEIFKISNNKQHVELKKPSSSEIAEAESNQTELLWVELNKIIQPGITEMVNLNKARQKGTRLRFEEDSKQGSLNEPKTTSNELKEKQIDEKPTGLIDRVIDDVIGENHKNIHRNKLLSILSEYTNDYGKYLEVVEDNKSKELLKVYFETDHFVIRINSSVLTEVESKKMLDIRYTSGVLLKSLCETYSQQSVPKESYMFIRGFTEMINNEMQLSQKKEGDLD
ncbi:MAG: hypothetical protein RG740_05665, partial [Acholeplasmataceae bacterium]|nr:hypothetical protein [Acholeplasmataceae bacterium]